MRRCCCLENLKDDVIENLLNVIREFIKCGWMMVSLRNETSNNMYFYASSFQASCIT